ncbi:MAG: hypothetical protein ABFD60_07830 [Bryobacteraceae bacterium]
MAIQFSAAVRNAMLDGIETAIGVNAILKIRTNAVPANTSAADAGTVLANIALGSDWLANAANGAKAKNGTWQDTAADANGTAGHWRVYANDGTTCHIQGNCTNTGGGGEMTLDNVSIAVNQTVTVTGFTLTAGNA